MTLLASDKAATDQPGLGAVLNHSSHLRFLLIEDSTTDTELVRALLEDEFPNGDVEEATSLELALRCLAASDYDVILADLTLPDAEGEEVVRAVRRVCPHTALMVLTGRMDGTLALWAMAEGAQDYLIKGKHDGPRLAEALLHGLQRSRTEQLARSSLLSALKLEGEAIHRLRELDRAKDDFVATASHELRTPLTSITAYAELMRDDGGLTPDQTEFVAAILRNAARLAALTDDLLLLAGFDSNRPEMEMLEVDLRTVASSAEKVVATLATRKHLSVCFELPSRPALVSGDAGQLERLVLNLVGNAIKFSEDHGTVICRGSISTTEVTLEIIDTGIGIPDQDQQNLFTRFFRGSNARARAIQGTGLGLHIAASIVIKHRGHISVDSLAGRGTTVTVRLPRRPD